MAHLVSHGGGCCGIRHLRSFTGLETAKGLLELINVNTAQGRTLSILIEAVLTNSQLKKNNEYLKKVMKEAGFKKVSSFCNPNSGNICNVFHYNKCPR